MSEAAAAEWCDPKSLKPWDKNPRKNDDAVKQVADSIRRFGFSAPIVARKENREIIAGHTRWKAARLLGLAKVPVRMLDISEHDAHLLALADNKLEEIADWDDAAVAHLLSTASFGDAMLAGWSGDELGKMADAIIGAPKTDDKQVELDEGFSVVVDCADEEEQLRVIAWCQEQDIKCRALI
jgi:hypothetical protein